MNESVDDWSELAMAIHLVTCQRKIRLKNRGMRLLTDHLSSLPALVNLSEDRLTDLFLSQEDTLKNWTGDGKRKIQEFARNWHHLVQDTGAQKEAIVLARSCRDRQIWPLLSGDPHYPPLLKEIDSCPAILFLRGPDPDILLQPSLWVTIVGTRTPTLYGQRVTRLITRDLCRAQAVIVSGLARGIDTVAHQTALEASGRTVGVIGCGHDFDYPPENARLISRMAESGIIISEHPPGVAPRRQNFPARNRILSGLSQVVAVMEASCHSGSLITAGFAADQGRDVFAVPGSILDEASAGCHQLIRDGAQILESARDILSEKSWQTDRTPAPDPPGLMPVGRVLSELERSILLSLRIQSLTLDELVKYCQAEAGCVLASVTLLELDGRISSVRGRYALTASGQSSI
jgi:DNA processing protein